MPVTEAELKAVAVAPRVTKEDVLEFIKREEFLYTQTLTFCVLTLINGYTVTGESACASPANYNKEIGDRLAKDNAINKIWGCLGFGLKTKLSLIEAAGKPSGKILSLGSPVTYVGTKVIHAVSMDKAEYCQLRGWTVPADENPEELGFLVQYTDGGVPNVPGFDGYVSWSPRAVFEKAYSVGVRQKPETFMDRLIAEMGELGEKVSKLKAFVEGEVFVSLPLAERTDLDNQLTYMILYLDVLSRRVGRLS